MARLKKVKLPSTQVEDLTLLDKIQLFTTRHKDMLGYIGVGIVVVATLATLVIFNNKSKEKQASILLHKGIRIYSSAVDTTPGKQESKDKTQTVSDAINSFDEIIDNYPGTSSGKLAQYLKASALLNSGDYQKAIDSFNAFIQSSPDHPMIPSAELGLATAEFNLGQIDASLSQLNDISRKYPDFPLMDIVDYEIAKRYEAKKDWEQATKKYQEVIDNFPDSSWKLLAQKRKDNIERENPAKKEVDTGKTSGKS